MMMVNFCLILMIKAVVLMSMLIFQILILKSVSQLPLKETF